MCGIARFCTSSLTPISGGRRRGFAAFAAQEPFRVAGPLAARRLLYKEAAIHNLSFILIPHAPSIALSLAERINLLIVDDDDDFRGTVLRRLVRRGFQVQEAVDGPSALELASRKEFDVAIIDLMMPGMTGLELLAKLKENDPDVRGRAADGAGDASKRPSRR